MLHKLLIDTAVVVGARENDSEYYSSVALKTSAEESIFAPDVYKKN